MQVMIKETKDIHELVIRDHRGIEWTQDLVGGAGCFVNGSFVWSEKDNAYLVGEDDYSWWDKYITDYKQSELDIAAAASKLGVDQDIIWNYVADELDPYDYDRHRIQTLCALAKAETELSPSDRAM